MLNDALCPAKITADDGLSPVFEIDSPYTAKLMSDFRHFSLFRFGNAKLSAAVISFVVTVLAVIFKYYLIAMIFGIVFLSVLFTYISSLKKINYTDEKFRIYDFYDDHFTVKYSCGAAYFSYDKIAKTAESDTLFIIMIQNRTAYFIDKSKIKDKKFNEFIKAHIQNKIHRR